MEKEKKRNAHKDPAWKGGIQEHSNEEKTRKKGKT